MLVGVAFQRGDIAAITIAVDHAVISKDSVGKFLHGSLLEVGGHSHFQIKRIALLIQRQRHENLSLFCTPTPLFACCCPSKVRIVKFDDAFSLCVLSRCPIATQMRLSMNQAVL